MAETSFIKTVAFGGYDKTETENLFEAMNLQICELQNELRQNKQLLDSYKTNPNEKENIDALLSAERTKLSQMQVQNETLAAKNKDLSAELRDAQIENRKLETEISELRKKLEEADTIKSSAEETQAAAEKLVEEAQKNADSIKEEARTETEKLKKETLDLIENVINEANGTAEKIIRDAEAKVAEMEAEMQKKAADAAKASNDRKGTVLDTVKKLEGELDKFRKIFAEFEKTGNDYIDAGDKLIAETRDAVEKTPEPEQIPVKEMPVIRASETRKRAKDLSAFEQFKARLYGDVAKEAGMDVKTAINQGVLYVNPPEQNSSNNFLYVNPPEPANTADSLKNVNTPAPAGTVKVVETVKVNGSAEAEEQTKKPDEAPEKAESREESAEKTEKATVVKVRRISANDREPVAVQSESAEKPAEPEETKSEEAKSEKTKPADEKPSAEETPAEKPVEEAAEEENAPEEAAPEEAEEEKQPEPEDQTDDLDMLMAMAEALNED